MAATGEAGQRAELLRRLAAALAAGSAPAGNEQEQLRAAATLEVLAAWRDPAGVPLAGFALGEAYERILDARVETAAGGIPRVTPSGSRRQHGSYYTPEPITREVARRTLEPLLQPLRGRPAAVRALRVLDPAMGCGGFLVACLDLLAEAAGDHGDLALRAELAAHCLYGVDADPAAVLIARLALARAVRGGHGGKTPSPAACPVTTYHEGGGRGVVGPRAREELLDEALSVVSPSDAGLAEHLRWGNALVGAPLCLAADPARATREELDRMAGAATGAPPLQAPPAPHVHWEFDFPEVFSGAEPAGRWGGTAWVPPHAGFDAVVGNPPYLQEARGNAQLFRWLRRSPWVAAHCERMTDLFHLFLCHSLALLREEGRLGVIVPDYWLSRTGAARVRDAVLARRLDSLVLFGDTRVFAGAPGHHSCIMVVDNRPPRGGDPLADARVLRIDPRRDPVAQLERDVGGGEVVRALQGRFLVLDAGAAALLERLLRSAHFLLEPGSVSNGLQSYPDRVRGQGVFVLTAAEVAALELAPDERALVKPFLPTRDLRRFVPAQPAGMFVLYIDAQARAQIESDRVGRFARVRAHLDRFRAEMTSAAAPYGLHRPRARRFFEADNRLIMPRKSARPTLAPVEQPLYADESANLLLVPEGVDRDVLLGVLSSTLAHWFFHTLKHQGSRLQLDTEVLLRFPLPVMLRQPPHLDPVGAAALAELAGAVRAARGGELAATQASIDVQVARVCGLDFSDCELIERFRQACTTAPRRRAPSSG